MKNFKCRDIGYDCDWEVSSEDENLILEESRVHGQQEHGLADFGDDIKNKVRSLIKDQGSSDKKSAA